jgi:hypothetical protein
MQIQLDTAFLDQLKLTDKAAFVSGKLDIDTKGIKIDEVQGIARFTNIQVGYDSRFLEVGDFFLQSILAGEARTMSLNSDYLVASATGEFNLKQMASDLLVLKDQYISIILNEQQPIADLKRNFSESYSLDLNVRMANINPIVHLFEPEFTISKNTILEGAFYQTPENTIFNFFSSIDSLTYDGNTALATNIDFNTSKIINSDEILASFYVYSKAQKIGKGLEFKNLGLEAKRNIKCRHPSRHVLRCGGRDLPSGFRVVGTSVIFNPLREAFTTISLANSIPLDFKFKLRIASVLKARRPQ